MLGETKKVTLRWVKAHAGHDLNDVADSLAKAGAGSDVNTAFLNIPYSAYKLAVKERLYRIWEQRWQARDDCRQTKIWFPSPTNERAKDLLKLDRDKLSVAVQFITGHNYLNYHMNKIDRSNESTCRLCRAGEESAWHLYSTCDGLAPARWHVLHTLHDVQSPPSWSAKQISHFLRDTTLAKLLVQRGAE